MKTALFLAALTVAAGYLAVWILKIPLRSSRHGSFGRRHGRRLRSLLAPLNVGQASAGRLGKFPSHLEAGRATASRLGKAFWQKNLGKSSAGGDADGAGGASPVMHSRAGVASRLSRAGSRSFPSVRGTRPRPPAGPPIVEWPIVDRRSRSRIWASAKLLMVIIGLGAGMAVLTLIVVRWIGLLLQQASS